MRISNNRFNGLYRSHQAVVFGVCRGIAEHFDFSVFWMRFITLVSLILSGLWPILFLYILATLAMKTEPTFTTNGDDGGDAFHYNDTDLKSKSLSRVKRRFDSLEKRIRRMEDSVVSKEFDWDRKL